MKLIVDVPNNVYAKVMEYCEHNEIVEAVYGYIYRGIPLEQIRAEIKHLLNRPSLTHVVGYDKGFIDGIDKVLQIIDNYR